MRRLLALVLLGFVVWLIPVWLLNGGPLDTPVLSDAAAICEGSNIYDCPGHLGEVASASPGALIAVCNYSDGTGGIAILQKPEDAAAQCDASAAGLEMDILRVVRLSRTASFPPYVPPTQTNLLHPEIGVPYDYTVVLDCGSFRGIFIDGKVWPPVTVPITDAPRFAVGVDQGTLELSTDSHAKYTSSVGSVVWVERSERPMPAVQGCS